MTACEGDAAELTITLPALLDPDADLSDEQIVGVSDGRSTEVVSVFAGSPSCR